MLWARVDVAAPDVRLDDHPALTVFTADLIGVFGQAEGGYLFKGIEHVALSDQERRQSGVQNDFSNMVRTIACDLRGDTSEDFLQLRQMPSISIDLPKTKHGYSIQADEVFWVKHGILRATDLRDSMDEQCIADISSCIVGGNLIERSTLSSIDYHNYHGLGIIIVTVQKQSDISFVGDDCYFREGDDTKKASIKEVAEISKRFQK